jgi:hypothetical protein
MKLTSDLLLEPLLSQFLPGFEHEREALGAPLLDPRFHPRGTCRVHDQRDSWSSGTWRAEPPQGIQEADPRHVEVLAHR